MNELPLDIETMAVMVQFIKVSHALRRYFDVENSVSASALVRWI